MQAPLGDNQYSSLSTRFGKLGFYTLLCFALAGLIAGFAVGGFANRSASGSTANSGSSANNMPTIAGHSPNPTATATPENVQVGEPVIAAGDYTSPERADDSTSYTFSAQIVNKADNTPITATDVTCRFWLTADAQATADALSANNYAIPRSISGFNQPFPQEVTGALTFTAPSQQTQSCAANGKTRWTYTLNQGIHHGTYYLAVLADWKGIHYNWYMVAVAIHGADNDNH